MRLIAIGCEYAGKTTLFEGLMKWGRGRGIHHHLDDHFSIPDCQMLKEKADQEVMLGLPQALKERYQRFQVAYHVDLINKYEHILLAGFHIEEDVYGHRYYYPEVNLGVDSARRDETKMPEDTILVHMKASPAAIRKRMSDAPHAYPVVPEGDVDEILAEFQSEYRQTWIKRKFEIDTSELSAGDLLETFLAASTPHLSERDLLIRQNSKS